MFFCDWLNIEQDFPDWSGRDFFGGRVVSVSGAAQFGRRMVCDDITGELTEQWSLTDVDDIDYDTARFDSHRGSFETNLLIRCIRGRLEVRGNPSAFGRLDNVFGFGLDESIAYLNRALADVGLPQFTTGVRRRYWLQDDQKWADDWSGAKITRCDMTVNCAVGMGNVRHFNRWLMEQKLYRSAPEDEQLAKVARWNFDTVYMSASKYWINAKSYDKAAALQDVTLPEYEKRLRRACRDGKMSTGTMYQLYDEAKLYLNNLAAWCAERGLARVEYSYRSRYMAQCEEKPGLWVPGKSEAFFVDRSCFEFKKIGDRALVIQGDYMEKLTASEAGWFGRWEEGADLREMMPKPTFYRVRASILKKTGHDIAARPIRVKAARLAPVYFQIRPLSLADAPSFYRSPVDLLAA